MTEPNFQIQVESIGNKAILTITTNNPSQAFEFREILSTMATVLAEKLQEPPQPKKRKKGFRNP